MDIVNETPSIVNIQRFPQREDERKKAKKKYPQSSESFHEYLKKAFEKDAFGGDGLVVKKGKKTFHRFTI